ncbi:collagen alpha-1(I) chain-like [Mustela putorius furo]|uniref:Collagen alpha-1(I) chain-like n=1 Tax=Mustela putorius furo TaxID=9669 RepID=A0A8U0SHY8_MUSPF|nr:collagen alpha-1(I) chain-like [Mustela putorius furo]
MAGLRSPGMGEPSSAGPLAPKKGGPLHGRPATSQRFRLHDTRPTRASAGLGGLLAGRGSLGRGLWGQRQGKGDRDPAARAPGPKKGGPLHGRPATSQRFRLHDTRPTRASAGLGGLLTQQRGPPGPKKGGPLHGRPATSQRFRLHDTRPTRASAGLGGLLAGRGSLGRGLWGQRQGKGDRDPAARAPGPKKGGPLHGRPATSQRFRLHDTRPTRASAGLGGLLLTQQRGPLAPKRAARCTGGRPQASQRFRLHDTRPTRASAGLGGLLAGRGSLGRGLWGQRQGKGDRDPAARAPGPKKGGPLHGRPATSQRFRLHDTRPTRASAGLGGLLAGRGSLGRGLWGQRQGKGDRDPAARAPGPKKGGPLHGRPATSQRFRLHDTRPTRASAGLGGLLAGRGSLGRGLWGQRQGKGDRDPAARAPGPKKGGPLHGRPATSQRFRLHDTRPTRASAGLGGLLAGPSSAGPPWPKKGRPAARAAGRHSQRFRLHDTRPTRASAGLGGLLTQQRGGPGPKKGGPLHGRPATSQRFRLHDTRPTRASAGLGGLLAGRGSLGRGLWGQRQGKGDRDPAARAPGPKKGGPLHGRPATSQRFRLHDTRPTRASAGLGGLLAGPSSAGAPGPKKGGPLHGRPATSQRFRLHDTRPTRASAGLGGLLAGRGSLGRGLWGQRQGKGDRDPAARAPGPKKGGPLHGRPATSQRFRLHDTRPTRASAGLGGLLAGRGSLGRGLWGQRQGKGDRDPAARAPGPKKGGPLHGRPATSQRFRLHDTRPTRASAGLGGLLAGRGSLGRGLWGQRQGKGDRDPAARAPGPKKGGPLHGRPATSQRFRLHDTRPTRASAGLGGLLAGRGSLGRGLWGQRQGKGDRDPAARAPGPKKGGPLHGRPATSQRFRLHDTRPTRASAGLGGLLAGRGSLGRGLWGQRQGKGDRGARDARDGRPPWASGAVGTRLHAASPRHSEGNREAVSLSKTGGAPHRAKRGPGPPPHPTPED